jgi:hypothetical protein
MQMNYPLWTYHVGLVFHPFCEILMIICIGGIYCHLHGEHHQKQRFYYLCFQYATASVV